MKKITTIVLIFLILMLPGCEDVIADGARQLYHTITVVITIMLVIGAIYLIGFIILWISKK